MLIKWIASWKWWTFSLPIREAHHDILKLCALSDQYSETQQIEFSTTLDRDKMQIFTFVIEQCFTVFIEKLLKGLSKSFSY